MSKPVIAAGLAVLLLASGWAWTAFRLAADRRAGAEAARDLAAAQATIASLEERLAAARAAEITRSPPAPRHEPETAPTPVPLPSDPEPLMVATVMQANAEGPPPLTEATIGAIERFDYAMDREFDRLEQREQQVEDDAEAATITLIKDQLTALDDLYRRADTASSDEERLAIRQEMQTTMGSIIGLSRRDRNERLAGLATQVGYDDPAAIDQFVREIDRIYRETHMDWTKLFNRTPPALGPAPGQAVSPGMGAPPAE